MGSNSHPSWIVRSPTGRSSCGRLTSQSLSILTFCSSIQNVMSSGSKRMKWPTLTKGTRLSATRRRICRGEVASHPARTSMSTSRRWVGDVEGPGCRVSVLAWLLPSDSGGPVSNGDIDAGIIAHPIGGRLVHGGTPREHGKRAPAARYLISRSRYGICSPVTNRYRASSSFRSRRTSLWLGRPLGCPLRSSKRANQVAQCRSSRERERAPSRVVSVRRPSPSRCCLEGGVLVTLHHPSGALRTG